MDIKNPGYLRKEQLTRMRRYFLNYLRHATLRKIINLARIEYKLMRSDHDLKNSYPYCMIVDISNRCNLKCPVCLTGQERLAPRKNLMSLQNYISSVTPLKDFLFQVSLYNWGEPFLNKDIYEMIRFNTSENIGTVVSSNLNLPIDAERLVESGLEHLVISADGVTQETYERYRVGGKLSLIFDNLERLIRAKKRSGSRFPYVEWQCLVTKWNESQLDGIKKVALSSGADEVRFCSINFYSSQNPKQDKERWLPQNPAYRMFASPSVTDSTSRRVPCFWLWRTSVVNADGGLTPCCLFDAPSWGNIFEKDFSSIWSNELFTRARTFSSGEPGSQSAGLICEDCRESYITIS